MIYVVEDISVMKHGENKNILLMSSIFLHPCTTLNCNFHDPEAEVHVYIVKVHHYTPRERTSGGYIGITLSVCPSVCADLCLAYNGFFLFDIGLPYLEHGCITMIQCVAYIHDPDTTL